MVQIAKPDAAAIEVTAALPRDICALRRGTAVMKRERGERAFVRRYNVHQKPQPNVWRPMIPSSQSCGLAQACPVGRAHGGPYLCHNITRGSG
eukprot:SAG31_NODE_1108_length_9862_cov_5.407662_2_plen_93_part_00